MPIAQPVAHRRCASCARWAGERLADTENGHVIIDNDALPGACVGGPWNGAERPARSACGRWIVWPPVSAGDC